MKLKSKKYIAYNGKVVDLCVSNSHTYNVEGLGVHNSGAGSLVNYLLGITQIDPLKYGLMFERFVSVARCLEKGTKVLMFDGSSKNIEDVVIGDEVQTDDGNRLVVDTSRSQHDEVLEIVVGEQTFVCSSNHLWPIIREGKYITVRADELLETDEVMLRADK